MLDPELAKSFIHLLLRPPNLPYRAAISSLAHTPGCLRALLPQPIAGD